jgi:NTP pyrophosphatase (non-canonical NTP hydrolase)
MNINEVMSKMTEELRRAEKIHPDFPKDIVYQCAIMIEEAGETMKAVLDFKSNKVQLEEVKKEAIQTGAMILRFLKNLQEG